MNIHILQHVPYENIGLLESILDSKENKITYTKFFEDHRMPFIDICDILIVLGGPMSVHDEDIYPWLITEKKFIEKAILKNKKVLGICLGAQLIAEILGGKVYENENREIGWYPIQLNTSIKKNPLLKNIPTEFVPLHWHKETFDLPNACIPLASSNCTKDQGFLFENKVLALQFHLEVDETLLKNLIKNNIGEISSEGPYVQDEQTLISQQKIESNTIILKQLIQNFIQL